MLQSWKVPEHCRSNLPHPKRHELQGNVEVVLHTYFTVLECLTNGNIGLKKVLCSNRVISITVRNTKTQTNTKRNKQSPKLCCVNWVLFPSWILENEDQMPPYAGKINDCDWRLESFREAHARGQGSPREQGNDLCIEISSSTGFRVAFSFKKLW